MQVYNLRKQFAPVSYRQGRMHPKICYPLQQSYISTTSEEHAPCTGLIEPCPLAPTALRLCTAAPWRPHELSRSPSFSMTRCRRLGSSLHKPATLCFSFTRRPISRNRCPNSSRVSRHGAAGAVLVSSPRTQATAVSCRSTSARKPGCTRREAVLSERSSE